MSLEAGEPANGNVQCEMSSEQCEIRDPLLWSRSSHTETAEFTERGRVARWDKNAYTFAQRIRQDYFEQMSQPTRHIRRLGRDFAATYRIGRKFATIHRLGGDIAAVRVIGCAWYAAQ